jgi:YD repeat-containing protein
MVMSSGWYFPYISQTIVMNYEGLSTYRATAKQFTYDPNTENLVEEVDLGEVNNVVLNGQTFTQVGTTPVYTWMTYTSLGRPSDVKLTSDSAGNNRLRETQMSYDSRGNLTGNQVWLDTASGFITTTTTVYDQYGNPIQATDAAGITTSTTYDPTYQQYPISQSTAGFVNQFTYDVRSGATVQAIDAKGLVASNAFDVLYRSIGTYISTTPNGAPTLWKAKMSYTLGGVSPTYGRQSMSSKNCVLKEVNNVLDAVNGFQTYTYLDGLGRTIQTRAESETAGQYRVANGCGTIPAVSSVPAPDHGENDAICIHFPDDIVACVR